MLIKKMDAKAAVNLAKQRIADLFVDEGIKNLGLEEADFDETNEIWRITLGFSRPWDEPKNALAAIAAQGTYGRRAFKTVRIDDKTGNVISVKGAYVKA